MDIGASTTIICACNKHALGGFLPELCWWSRQLAFVGDLHHLSSSAAN